MKRQPNFPSSTGASKLKPILQHAAPALALLALLASIIGFCWLLRYCQVAKAPFPLNASELPIMVLAVGSIGTMHVLVFTLVALIPLLIRANTFDAQIRQLFEARQYDIRGIEVVDYRKGANYWRFAWLSMPTIALYALILAGSGTPELVFLFTTSGSLYLWGLWRFTRNHPGVLSRIINTTCAAFLILLWSIMTTNYFFADPIVDLENRSEMAKLVILVLGMLLPIPAFGAIALMPIGDIRGLWFRAGVVALCLAILYPLVRPEALRAPMQTLGIGGYQAEIVLNPTAATSALAQAPATTGKKAPVRIVLRLGSRTWFRRIDERDQTLWVVRDEDIVALTR